MNLRTGIDSVEIARFVGKEEKFIRKILTDGEIDYYRAKGSKPQTLAGLFAAKEAFLKMLGTGIFSGIGFSEVAVGHDEDGRPFYSLGKNAEKALLSLGLSSVDLSITHTDSVATAICVWF